MSYESEISGKIKTALTAAAPGLPISHFFESEAAGDVRKDARSKIGILVRPGGPEGLGEYHYYFSGTVFVESAIEDDPDMVLFQAAYEAVIGALRGYNKWELDRDLSELSGDSFQVDDFVVTGGDAGIDTTVKIWYAQIEFLLVGCPLDAGEEE